MHLFADYVQPLTSWLHTNPDWALLFTFLISCIESLAIIGSLIPGSLTMTAIGILAGSGVMRLDLTLLAASLGAMAGDGASYTLGYVFRDQLGHIWPFTRYPSLLQYGKDFFMRHGGKSVLIGRFVGPLRAIIPVIAGMMNMPHLHFFVANLLSAIGWALLYVMPGYLIGTASSQLSTESARRMLGFIVVLALMIWVISKLVHWIIRSLNRWYNSHLHTLYQWSAKHPYYKRLFRDLADQNDSINSLTITLFFAWILCFIVSICLCFFVIQDTWINVIDNPTSFFLQSLRTHLFDGFFIILNFMISPLSLFGFFLIIAGSAVYVRDWRLLRYWISLACVSVVITQLISLAIPIPNPDSLYTININATFPVINLTWATSLFGFIICYLVEYHRNELSSLLRVLLTALLMLSGFAAIYFGDNWLTSVMAAYFIGLTISLIHWIFYQRKKTPHRHVGVVIILSASALLVTTTIEYVYHFQSIVANHTAKPQQYEINEDTWWHQKKPLLPLYTTNRVGKPIGLFNIQYAGSIQQLQQKLHEHGWKKQSKPLLYALMIRADGQHSTEELPVMEQLYLNKRPTLIMTYQNTKNSNIYILRLWHSNYHLNQYQEPIWLGSVVLARTKSTLSHSDKHAKNSPPMTLFPPLLPAIKCYRVTEIKVHDPHIKSLRYGNPAELLLIKESVQD